MENEDRKLHNLIIAEIIYSSCNEVILILSNNEPLVDCFTALKDFVDSIYIIYPYKGTKYYKMTIKISNTAILLLQLNNFKL